MTENNSTDELPEDSTAAIGEKPGDSMRELFHGEHNVGANDAEQARQEDAKQAASDEADRMRNEPGHHGRQHL